MSLVEMLAVIVLLTILMSLLFPLTTKVRAIADHAGCLNNLRQWGVAIASYAADHGSLLPPMQMPLNRADPGSRLVGWDERLAPYVPYNYQEIKTNLAVRASTILVCPGEREFREAGDYTYAMNIDLNYRLQGEKALVRLNTLTNMSQYVLMSDSYRSLTLSTATEARLTTSIQPQRKRHGGKTNFLYADGHAAPFQEQLVGYNEVTEENRKFYNNLWFARGLPPYQR